MKIPDTDLEQKCWVIIAFLMFAALIGISFGLQEYGVYLVSVGIIGLGMFCFVAHKKKWIKNEV